MNKQIEKVADLLLPHIVDDNCDTGESYENIMMERECPECEGKGYVGWKCDSDYHSEGMKMPCDCCKPRICPLCKSGKQVREVMRDDVEPKIEKIGWEAGEAHGVDEINTWDLTDALKKAGWRAYAGSL